MLFIARGQIYVLISRCTDPANFELLGVPPIDLLEAVYEAWREAGCDANLCLRNCVEITKEFEFVEKQTEVKDKIKPRRIRENLVPVKHRTLAEILDPQPKCSAVLHKLLAWIDDCDLASQSGRPKPECVDENGQDIVPTDDDNLWWLTEMSARKKVDEGDRAKADEDGPPESEDEVSQKNDLTDDEESMSVDI